MPEQDFGEIDRKLKDDGDFNLQKKIKEHDNIVLENINIRDAEYSALLSSYRQYIVYILETNPYRQETFFIFSIAILLISFLVFLCIISNAIHSENPNIVVVLGGLAEVFVAFRIFPEIIAKYLFNTNENAVIKDIVEIIRKYDGKIEKDVRTGFSSLSKESTDQS